MAMAMRTTKLRRGLTIWKQKIIWLKREEPEHWHAKEKLYKFGEYFLDGQGLLVPTDTLSESDILKEKEKWLNFEFGSGST